MELQQFIPLIFIGGGAVMLAIVVNQLMKPDKVRLRVSRLAALDPTADREEVSETAYIRCIHSLLLMLGAQPDEVGKHMSKRFDRAGIESPHAVIHYLFFQRVLRYVLIFIGLVIIWRWMGLFTPTKLTTMLHFMIAGVFMFIGWKGAEIYLANRREKRTKKLQQSFPEALDLLLVCVEAGLALDSALSRVCRELRDSHPEITYELDKTRLELTVLNNRVQALHNLAERTNILGFKSLVSALVQSEKFGTSLSDTLRVLSEEYRNNRLMAAENRAARVPVLITIPMILFILPAFLLVVGGSPYINIKKQGGVFGDGR